MKVALVSALCACAGERQKRKARRFLQGLSEDELQFIAGFLGACILEAAAGLPSLAAQVADSFGAFEHRGGGPSGCGSLDCQEHKMVLLLEYLNRCAVGPSPVA